MNLSKIQAEVDAVLKYSQGIEEVNTDNLIAEWRAAKADFICKLGGLIREFPGVTFTLPDDVKTSRFNYFHNRVVNYYDNDELGSFLWGQGINAFYENIMSLDYVLSPDKIIPAGMKMVKAFKFFESNSEILAQIQNEASQIIQENKITGTLCVSVHPLDFLSLSENNAKWRSCHALDGEYRAGNLSYMVDSSTVICYLKSEENVQLHSFPDGMLWNNKKWRNLFYFSEDYSLVFAGRPYPFAPEDILNTVKPYLFSALGLRVDDFTKWDNQAIRNFTHADGMVSDLFEEYICIYNRLFAIRDVVEDREYSQQYNDVLYSTCYKPYYCHSIWHVPDKPKVLVGGAVDCICCGKDHVSDHDTMLCYNCNQNYNDEDYFTCDCCGRTEIRDVAYFSHDGEWICPTCANIYYAECYYCGQLVRTEEAQLDKERNVVLCPNCASNNNIEEGVVTNG
jgi:hypothetical protein